MKDLTKFNCLNINFLILIEKLIFVLYLQKQY